MSTRILSKGHIANVSTGILSTGDVACTSCLYPVCSHTHTHTLTRTHTHTRHLTLEQDVVAIQQRLETTEAILTERDRELAEAKEQVKTLSEDLKASQGKVGWEWDSGPRMGNGTLVLGWGMGLWS